MKINEYEQIITQKIVPLLHKPNYFYMRLTRKQTICNIPILKIRDYFNRIRPLMMTPEMIREQFELNEEQIEELIQALLAEGYIEPAKEKNEYQLTIKGHALCVARYTNPINKTKADKLFKEFMERVEEINSNDYYLYKVTKIVLFGSYIDPEKTDYADIDIAFKINRKAKSTKEFLKLDEQRIKEAEMAGKSFTSFFDELGYTERVVLHKLKNRCRYISLHPIDDDILKISKTKQVYP